MRAADKWAWLRSVVAAEDRTLASVAVGAAIAQHFNVERGAAWPAERTLSEWTRLDRRNVRRALAALEMAGLLAIVSRGGPRQSTRYALVMVAPEQPQRSPHSNRSGRPTAPSAVAPQRPEKKGSGSDSELIRKAAAARAGGGAADAAPPRACGGPANKPNPNKTARRRASRAVVAF